MQHRKDPNVEGLFGLLQHKVDGLKVMLKAHILPRNGNLFMHVMAPIITFILTLVAWVVKLFAAQGAFITMGMSQCTIPNLC